MDITPDSGHCKAMGPDMALGSNLGPDNTMAQFAPQATQISMALVVTWPLDTHMATGCGLDPGHPCDL